MKTKEIVVGLILFLFPPLGLILMWVLRVWPVWVRVVLTLLAAVIGLFTAGLFLLFLGFRPFRISGNAMSPTLIDREYVLTRTFFKNYQRGDIIVHRNPQFSDQVDINRIIGLPSEIVEIRDNKIFINNQELSEPYLQNQITNTLPETINPTQLIDDQYYVLGDKRENSIDSRTYGPLKKEDIIGTYWFSYSRP